MTNITEPNENPDIEEVTITDQETEDAVLIGKDIKMCITGIVSISDTNAK